MQKEKKKVQQQDSNKKQVVVPNQESKRRSRRTTYTYSNNSMFKFSRKTGPVEEEKLALAIAKSLSLQASAGGDGASSNHEGGEGGFVVGSPTNTRTLATPKVEIRQDAEGRWDDEDEDPIAPPLPEGSMKVGNKTPGNKDFKISTLAKSF